MSKPPMVIMRMAKSKSKSAKKTPKKSVPTTSGADRAVLERIATALERLAPRALTLPDFNAADAFAWQPDGHRLMPVPHVNRVEMSLLKGIDRMRDVLMDNTERFAKGLPANNALLWGARGMGKSSLVRRRTRRSTPCCASRASKPPSSSSKFTARTSRACRT
jgi:hypothetical protein